MNKNFKKYIKNGKKIICEFSDAVCDFSHFASKKAKAFNRIRYHRKTNVIAELFLIIVLFGMLMLIMFLKGKISEDL